MSDPEIKNSQFTGNKADESGDAVCAEGGHVVLQDSSFQQTKASEQGGAISADSVHTENK